MNYNTIQSFVCSLSTFWCSCAQAERPFKPVPSPLPMSFLSLWLSCSLFPSLNCACLFILMDIFGVEQIVANWYSCVESRPTARSSATLETRFASFVSMCRNFQATQLPNCFVPACVSHFWTTRFRGGNVLCAIVEEVVFLCGRCWHYPPEVILRFKTSASGGGTATGGLEMVTLQE